MADGGDDVGWWVGVVEEVVVDGIVWVVSGVG